MVATLQKTWRKDTLFIPEDVYAINEDATNAWALWAVKELLLLGNNGVKGGPNAWTVVGSCDSTQFAMDGTDYLLTYENMVSSTGNHSWFVLRNAALGAGLGLEICIAYHDDTTYDDEITFAWSWSAGFTGGALNARPTATDEIVVMDKSTNWGSRTTARRFEVHKLMSSDGEVSRIFHNEEGASLGVFFFEKLANPASWVDQNFLVLIHGNAPDPSDLTTATGGAWWCNLNGQSSRVSTEHLRWGGGLLLDEAFFKGPDYEGKWPMFSSSAFCRTSPNVGKIGDFFDMYSCPGSLPYLYTLPGAGGNHEFFVITNFAYGNDGTPMRI